MKQVIPVMLASLLGALLCGCASETAVVKGEVERLPLENLSLSEVASYAEGRMLVCRGEGQERRYGYLNEQGEVVIEPTYIMANVFADGILRTSLSPGTYCYVDKQGNVLISEVEGKTIAVADIFRDGYAVVSLSDNQYYVIDQTGKVVLSPGDASYQYRNLGGGLFARTAAADAPAGKGATVTGAGVTKVIKTDASMPYGDSICDLQCDKEGIGFYSLDGNLYGIWNHEKPETEPRYQQPQNLFSNGMAVVTTAENSLWVIDEKGACLLDLSKTYPELVRNSVGLVDQGVLAAELSTADTVSILPLDGSKPIHTAYDSIAAFHEGVAVSGKDGLYGYIDRNGQEILPTTYKVASTIENGVGFLVDGTDIFRFTVG